MTLAIEAVRRDGAMYSLQALGYKILLRDYDCPLGQIDYVAKRENGLVFISINRTAEEKIKAARASEYYVKRYGIKGVAIKCESYTVTT